MDMSPEQQLATAWRLERGYVGRGGVVVVYRDEVQSWVNALRDPDHWVAGCVAVAEDGQTWITIAGDEAKGALMWLPTGDPDGGMELDRSSPAL